MQIPRVSLGNHTTKSYARFLHTMNTLRSLLLAFLELYDENIHVFGT